MIAAPLHPREPHSHGRTYSGQLSAPRMANRCSGPQYSPQSDYFWVFGKVAGDTGFCRDPICGKDRCRPGSSWHIFNNFANDSFAHEVSGATRMDDLSVTHISGHFDQVHGSVTCAKPWTHPIRSAFYGRTLTPPGRAF